MGNKHFSALLQRLRDAVPNTHEHNELTGPIIDVAFRRDTNELMWGAAISVRPREPSRATRRARSARRWKHLYAASVDNAEDAVEQLRAKLIDV